MPLVDGATAAGFSIVRLLGCGQTGELYLAEHPRLPRQDALKIVSADLSADPEYRYRFKQTSGRAAVLRHPNIVSLHDRGEFEDRLWLSMDYVDGIDTAQLLTDTYPEGLPPDLVVDIVFAIADALDYAHELGLVHGYVNPSNILISNLESRRRRILLTGFGLPRRPDEINSLTRANLGIGTVSYAAPEQLMDDSIDGRTDLYALAGTAFHLLTGSPPFAHMNPAVVISKHLNDAPPRPGDVRPELTYFDTPFARALKKNPTERFRRCRDFAKALESKEGLGPYIPNAGAAALLTTPDTNGAAPTEPPAPPPPVATEPDPPAAQTVDAVAPPDILPENNFNDTPDVVASPDVVPETEVRDVPDVAAPPEVTPETEIGDAITLAEPDVWSAANHDTQAARRRRVLQTAGLGLAILTVAVGGILGVMALRSASASHDAPTDVETSSPVTTVRPARPAPATAIPPPPVVTAPPPVATTPPTPSTPPPSLAATTAPPTTSSAPPETTAPATTRTHLPAATTTTAPGGLDTRPAVGMPCGPPGTAATSNSGAPVVCADTPGGSAWEPPGG
jgi:serine/threonine-protein kinase